MMNKEKARFFIESENAKVYLLFSIDYDAASFLYDYVVN